MVYLHIFPRGKGVHDQLPAYEHLLALTEDSMLVI